MRRARKFIIKFLIYLLFVSISLIFICNLQIHPYATALVRAKAQNEITAEINDAIDTAVRQLNCTYADMISVYYSEDGRVSALSVDTVQVNLLRASILKEALKTLEYKKTHNVTIPIGSLIGELSSGKGPSIPITIILTDALQCSVVTDFYEAGINQTLHTISLKLKVSCKALIPTGSCTFDVTAECPIGQTVLIGDVPEAFTKINRLTDDITETEIDDIYDFGASAN